MVYKKGEIYAYVLSALYMSSRVIEVEIFMNVKNETCDASVWILNFVQCIGRTVGNESLCRCPAVTRKQYHLRSSAGVADGSDNSLRKQNVRSYATTWV